MKAVLALLLAGCADNAVAIDFTVDVPTNDNASAFPLDSLVLSVAHAGDAADLVSQTFTAGQTVTLPGVPFGDDLVIHMTGSVGSSEVAYGRTCQFAVSADVAPTPHLFFSREVKFGDLNVMPVQRVGGLALTDIDGTGLVVGGMDGSTPVTAVERFDPQTGTLATLGDLRSREGAVAAALGVGGDTRIALIGGKDSATETGATYIELIAPDAPETRRIDSVDDAQMARTGLTATTLSDGRVIAIGGLDGATPSGAVDEVSIDNGSATVRVLTRAVLTSPRSQHTATRLGDDVGASVLVIGGIDSTGTPIATAELFKPLKEEFSTTTYPGRARRGHHSVLMPDGSVLVMGGCGAMTCLTDGTAVAQLELFTLDEGFKDVDNGLLPSNAGLLDFAATPLPDGRVLITGGRRCDNCDPLDTAFIARLDPIDGTVDVVATDHMSVARAGHSATLLCDGTILITGGTADPSSAERYNPPSLDRR
ncbi:MAG: kelch repeat-containing protein [Kofleriaceae bacterium]